MKVTGVQVHLNMGEPTATDSNVSHIMFVVHVSGYFRLHVLKEI